MDKLNFEELFDKAAQKHGHKCPSLFYGVKGAITAILFAQDKNITITKTAVYGSSKCIRDGASTVFEQILRLTPNIEDTGCGVSVGNERQMIQVKVKTEIREEINSLNKKLPTKEFQQTGLKYLTSLDKEKLFDIL